MSSEKFVASCACGQCQVEADGPPGWVVNCHCSQCRRTLSANYATLCGYNANAIRVIKGELNLVGFYTGKEERISCRICGSKVYVKLYHLNQWAIYQDNFTTPNHGVDGKIDKRVKPTAHIFYTSGTTSIYDKLPKYVTLPKAFGGDDKTVPDDYHDTR